MNSEAPERPHRAAYWAAVGAVLTAAAVLRLGAVTTAPIGLHVDEGFHLLQAQAIAAGRSLPVFITGNYGNEPGFAYLAALAIAGVGPQAWAGRLASALAGILTVGLVMRVALELFPDRRWLAVWAGAALAGLYWHVHFSHYGSQPILAPLTACLVVAGLARSWRTGSRWAAIGAGVALGLSLYAYVVMRLFPFVVIGFGLCFAIARRPRWRWIATSTALALGVAAIVAAPLALFFIQNPGWFLNRASQIATVAPGADLGALADQTFKTLAGLFWRGDQDARYNLPGRPAFDVLQIVAFVAGLWVLGTRRRDPAAWVIVLWMAAGLAPSMITEGAPQFGRTTLATPALALCLALGLDALRSRLSPRAGMLAVTAALALSAGLTGYDYFAKYASAPDTFATLNGDEWTIAQGLRAAPDPTRLFGSPVQRDYYLDYATAGARLSREQFGAWDRGYWSIAYLLGDDAYARFTGYNGRECVVAPVDAPAWYMVRADQGDRTPEFLRALGALKADPVDPGVPGFVFDRYVLTPPYVAQPARTAYVRFPELATLLGSDLPSNALHAGDPLTVALWWRVDARTTEPFKLFLHVRERDAADAPILTQRDAEPCLNSLPTWAWTPGDIVYDVATMTLPTDIAPGPYRVDAGWYQANGDGARRPAESLDGAALGDTVTVLEFEVLP